MQKSPVPGVDLTLSLCGEDGIDFNGEKFVPDATKSYFMFKFSHAFPVATVYQTALHPNVIGKSFNSLKHQNLNYEHQISSYHEGKDVRDKVIGAIVAVDYPRSPIGGWKVNPDASQSPGITGVASMFKQTSGMTRILGEHSSGRRKYAVSMEVLYPLEESGFAVQLASNAKGERKDPEFNFTPPDVLAAGYEYVPYDKAPGELIATFSRKKERVTAQWKGRKCFVLMGGLDNPVHYAGAGVVHFPAESSAKILRLAASETDPLSSLAQRLVSILAV